MSYDVSIGDHSFNYTSNVSGLFYEHIPDEAQGGGLHELDGKTGKHACGILQQAFERMNSTRHSLYVDSACGEPRFCVRYDAENGWGSTVGGLIFLAEILAACALNPRKIVSVSA